MKKSLLAGVALASAMSFSPVFAAEVETIQLSAVQMDSVTAGRRSSSNSFVQRITQTSKTNQDAICIGACGIAVSVFGDANATGIYQSATTTLTLRNRTRVRQ